MSISPALTDFALAGLDGTRHAAHGEWTVRFGVAGTERHGQGFTEMKLEALAEMKAY